jgi:hypothetical protein
VRDLIEAVTSIRRKRDVNLVVIGKPRRAGPSRSW